MSLKILIADDYQPAADTMGRMLEVLGHEVCVTYDGRDAIAKAKELIPDVILLDLGMPRMNGFEICKKLRA